MYNTTQQTYSLHAVYIILLLIHNFLHFPSFFAVSFKI